MDELVTFRSTALPEGTRVVGFHGTEAISRHYAFEIHLSLPPDESGAFELDDAVGQKGTLAIDRQDGRPPFSFHGVFAEATIVDDETDGRAIVRAMLVPRLWRLTQTLHSRVFTGQSIPEIVATVLDGGGLAPTDYSLRLSGAYLAEEHVCQYRESDFDFLSRWMEREGLYYFFEQGEDGEKLIIADDKAVHEPLLPAPVRFVPLSGADATARECVQRFECRRRALPASVRLQDYDYTKPALDVSGTALVSTSGLGEVNVHGARFFSPTAGERLARLRAEELLARAAVFTGSGTALYLRAGYTFELEHHPRFEARYLAIEVEHRGCQAAALPETRRRFGLTGDEVYRADMKAILASVQFRAEARTTWPRIYGTEHGVVDGEADTDYAQIDAEGRYVVRFAFDESDLGDGKASTRVRMMQPHGGSPEGWHFPLRKGTEVLFTFLGGDPDRPVIAGVVPTAVTPSPVTSANHTRNVIETGGRNQIVMEDEEGSQQITIATPTASTTISMGAPDDGHELLLHTDANALLDTGANLDVEVRGNLTEKVAGTTDETYVGAHSTTSSATRTVKIGGAYSQTCGASVTRTVAANDKHTVAGEARQTYGSQVHVVLAAATHTVLGAETHLVTGPVTQTYGPVTGVWASLNLSIPGGATIFTPEWKVVSPEQGWITSAAKLVFGEDTEVKGSSTELVGLGFEVTAIKVEATNVHADTDGVHFENAGFKQENHPLEWSKAGLTLKQRGLGLLSYGLCKIG